MNHKIKKHIPFGKFQLEQVKIPAYLKLLFKLTVSGFAVWFVSQQIDVPSALQDVSKFSFISLLGVFVFYNSSQIISAHRLNGLFRVEGITLSKLNNLRLYYKGMFYNLILPGSIGGDGYKALMLKGAFGVPWKNLVRSLLVDRVSGFLVLLYLVIPLYLLHVKEIDWMYWVLATVTLITLYPLFYFSLKKVAPQYEQQIDISLALSFFVQLFQILAALCLAMALDIPLIAFIFIFLLSSAASAIPFTLGGIGAREFVFVSIGGIFGLVEEHGFIFSVVFYLVTVVSSLLGAFISPRLQKHEQLVSIT